MAQRTGRLSCSRCGANNFDTVTSCWKCGTALSSAPVSMPAPVNVAVMPTTPAMGGERAVPVSMPAAIPIAPTGDSALAKRAAIWLALTFPYFGLPIGWAFMMIEDRRRQAIGRLCVNWSLLSLVLHLFLFSLGVQAMAKSILPFLTAYMGGLQKSRGMSPDSGLPSGLEDH